MDHNEVISEIICFTERFIEERNQLPFSEHDLLSAINKTSLFSSLQAQEPGLLLFQKHFLCMHALYTLQKHYYQNNQALFVSPLAIHLEPITQNQNQQISEFDNPLRDYYLDLRILDQATSESVEELQKAFFKRYQAWLQGDHALQTLQLEKGASWREIQKQYRKLTQSCHPDKGGDATEFQKIQHAYEQLKLKKSNF